MKKLIVLFLLIVTNVFSARMTINIYGEEQVQILNENDQIGFSENGDTLYFYKYTGSVNDFITPAKTYYLGTINRVTFDTVGGTLPNLVITSNGNSNVLDYSIIAGIIFEPEVKDTGDWDGDGLTNHNEMIVYGTDPRKADTDGDGFNDDFELSQFSADSDPLIFNPKIADLPEIALTISSYPKIDFWYTDSHGTSQSKSVVNGEELSSTNTVTKVTSEAYSHTHGWEVSTSYGTADEVGFSVSASVNGSYTTENTTEYGTEYSIENTRSFEIAKSYETSNEITYEKAVMSFDVTLTNPGNIVYTVNNLVLNAYLRDRNSVSIISNVEVGGDKPFIMDLKSQNKRHVTAELSIENARKLFSSLDYISCGIDGYSFSHTTADGTTKDFTAASTNTSARCADIIIDFGIKSGKKPIVKKVATMTKYNPNHMFINDMYNKVTLKDIFSTLNLAYSIGTREVNNNDGLMTVAGIKTDVKENGYWYIIHKYAKNDSVRIFSVRNNSVNPDTISINTRDVVHIIYSKDADGDSLADYLEELYNTSDNNTDTDSDGISDYREVVGFEKNGKIYQTNPLKKDTDGDDVNDKDDDNPIYRPLGTSSNIDSVLMIDGSKSLKMSFSKTSTKRTTLDSSYLSGTFEILTKKVPASVNVKLNGRNLVVKESSTSKRRFKTSSNFDKVLNKMEIVVISEDHSDTSNYVLDIYSPLKNNTKLSISNTIEYCWKQLQLNINNELQSKEPRTSFVNVFRSSSKNHLIAFKPKNEDSPYTTASVYGDNRDIYVSKVVNPLENPTYINTGLSSGTTYYYCQVPVYYDSENGTYWYGEKSEIKSDKTYHNSTTIEFWKYEIIDEADGSGTCEIYHRYYYKINGTVMGNITSELTEDLDAGDVKDWHTTKKKITIKDGDHLTTYLTLYEDDPPGNDDDYNWDNAKIFGGNDGYDIEELSTLGGNSSWKIGDGLYLKDWSETTENDSKVKAFARLWTTFEK